MMNCRETMPLDQMITKILEQLSNAGFSPGTIWNYEKIFKRLTTMADSLGKEFFDQELADQFILDNEYKHGKGYCHSRYLFHARCIQFVESYIDSGVVDWSVMHRPPSRQLKSDELIFCFDTFKSSMEKDSLKPNTIEGYLRFVLYFLSYLEDKGYNALSQVKAGDITFFMVLVCQEHYSPTSVGSHLPGLRRFVRLFPEISGFESEIPDLIPKKYDIIPSYSDEECEKIDQCLLKSEMSSRNRAIALIAFETGLRAVDICNLKLENIDWKQDSIHIVQAKTGKPLIIPLRPAVGNALMAYLLEERPASESPYVFLSLNAPYNPLSNHSGIYNVLRKIIKEAGVEPNGRISGSRMTRHTFASRMLRNGVPLSVISEAMGHNSPDSTMRYLSTDNKALAMCTLPLPKKEVRDE